ncbi:MAG: hypothetical protein IKA48_01880 [Fibrobacter sp.]|nr:hypothetical protein [Fibrobacter sp.]
MTQAENNKAAMDRIFALEDSKELFEAVGNLNDDQSMMNGGIQDDTEYGVDDMLTVVPGSTDPFAGQSITTQQEPSDEEKRFVIDEFAAQMAQAHKTIVDKEAIDTFSPIIQDKVSMNVNQFLTDVQNAATQRLSAQNVSDAQPTGATPEETLALADQQQGGADAGMDPNAAMGTPAMEPAPGGIAPEPSLDANVGDDMGGDLGLGQTDDLGLGGEGGDDLGLGGEGGDDLGLGGEGGDDLGLGGEGGDDLGLGGEGGDDLGLGGEGGDLGGEGGEGGDLGGEGGDDLGLGGEGDEGGDLGGEGGDLGGEGDKGDDDVLGGESNLDSLDDDQFGDDDESKSSFGDDSDAEFESEMASSRAILESLHDKYVEDKARDDIRVLVESFQRAKAAKKAQLEAAQADKAEPAEQPETDVKATANDAQANEECDQTEMVESAMRNELGDKVAAMVESSSKAKAEAILENAAKAFNGAVKRKSAAQMKARLRTQLESISANYHASVARERSAKVEKARALHESASVTKTAPKPSTLSQKLANIVASVK